MAGKNWVYSFGLDNRLLPEERTLIYNTLVSYAEDTDLFKIITIQDNGDDPKFYYRYVIKFTVPAGAHMLAIVYNSIKTAVDDIVKNVESRTWQ